MSSVFDFVSFDLELTPACREVVTSYGLVSYTTSGVSTPTPLSDYDYLSSQWASASYNTDAPSTVPTPSCPASTGSYWPVDPSAALPTIAGLDFATVRPAGASATPTSTSTGSTGSSSPTRSGSGLSSGAKAGIGVGIALGVILVLSVLFWFLFARRRKNKGEENTPPETAPESEMPATANWNQTAAPSELAAPPSELACPETRAQELDSAAIHEADNGGTRPIDGGGTIHKPVEYR